MKKCLLAVAAVCMMSMTANAAVLRLSSSGTDANAGSSLNLTVGSTGSLWVWVSTPAGQQISGLGLSITSSDTSVITSTAHTIENPAGPPARWASTGAGTVGAGAAAAGQLVQNSNAFIFTPPIGNQTGINTGDENTFVLHSRVDFTVDAVGTTNLATARGSADITEGAAFATIPDAGITFGAGSVTAVVPEPGSLTVLGLALVGAARFRRRRV